MVRRWPAIRPGHLTRYAVSVLLMSAFAVTGSSFAWEELGQDAYESHCAACHQPQGAGVEGVFPALVDNEFVLGAKQPLIQLVLDGRAGMPAFRGILADEELAAVLSYIRTSWGNQAEPVQEETVADVRAEVDPTEPIDAVELTENWEEHGADLFARNCRACHQAEGEGIPGLYPQLADSAFVMGDPESLIQVVLDGRAGMPSFRTELSDEELSHLLSVIRTSWGNEAPVIGPDMVAAVRGDEVEEEPTFRPGVAD